MVVLLTGLSGAGKTTLARTLERDLTRIGLRVEVFDGDIVRQETNDLGYTEEDRGEQLRRLARKSLAALAHCDIVLVAAIAPYRSHRQEFRESVPDSLEVYVNASVEVCAQRDPKNLYWKAFAGQIVDFTGVTAPYETPEVPCIRCDTDKESVEESSQKVFDVILVEINRMEVFCVPDTTGQGVSLQPSVK